MKDFTDEMFSENGWLRLEKSNGFNWYAHLGEAVVGACEGNAQAREYHMGEAVMSYVASLQRLRLAMEPVYVSIDWDDVKAHVTAAATTHPASFEPEYAACRDEFEKAALTLMADIIPNLSTLGDEFNLVSNGYIGVCSELPWGTGATFIQAGYKAGIIKVRFSCPTKLEFHPRPRPTPSVDLIEERLAGYKEIAGLSPSAPAAYQDVPGLAPTDDEMERLAMEEQMMRF